MNCMPPWHLSPIGPVEYLREMLLASAELTCEDPAPAADPTLDDLLRGRLRPLGLLDATAANVHTPIPLIDLVNEVLEQAFEPAPAVLNTNRTLLGEHDLRPAGVSEPCAPTADPFRHDPAVMFAVMPEHSSPATPAVQSTAYTRLNSDFTSPALPYSQQADIFRTYLGAIGTTRFQAMRTFREKITEFVIDPAREPAAFQSDLWRKPVRVNIAREYLHVSPEEHNLLYTQNIVTVPAPGRLLLREL